MDCELDHDTYSAYLNQHLSAADAGAELFRAAARTWQGTVLEGMFEQLHEEERESHAKVLALIESLGYEVSTVRNALSGLVSAVGRHSPLNPSRSQDGRMTQLEFDALVSAIRAQQAMWETLWVLSEIDERLDKADCAAMVQRCTDQQERVRTMSQETAVMRFTSRSESSSPS